jgi:hypothetical protein
MMTALGEVSFFESFVRMTFSLTSDPTDDYHVPCQWCFRTLRFEIL